MKVVVNGPRLDKVNVSVNVAEEDTPHIVVLVVMTMVLDIVWGLTLLLMEMGVVQGKRENFLFPLSFFLLFLWRPRLARTSLLRQPLHQLRCMRWMKRDHRYFLLGGWEVVYSLKGKGVMRREISLPKLISLNAKDNR